MTDPSPSKEAELIELVRAIDVRAPESLHASVRALVDDRSAARDANRAAPAVHPRERARRQPLGPRIAAVGALAAVVIAALIIGVSSGGGGASTLTVPQASALTVAQATSAAPIESPRENGTLYASMDGVSFPYWEDRFGWRSTGARTDSLAGRTIKTVYYSDDGRRIGYAIVGGSPAPKVSGGRIETVGGRPFRVTTINGRPVITWIRDGHLCVVSGRGVDSTTLLRLASWTDDDTLS